MSAITFKDGVVRTDRTDLLITKLEPHFVEAGITAVVSSVKREPAEQFKIIFNLGVKEKLINVEFTPLARFSGEPLCDGSPYWIYIWSELLERGYLIAPPVRAKITSGKRTGQFRDPSKHFLGLAVDLSPCSVMPVIERVIGIDAEIKTLVSKTLEEPLQNCAHVEVTEA